jgi:hypothetical protein
MGWFRALTARLVSSAMEGGGASWRTLRASSSHADGRRGCGEWREGGEEAAALFGIRHRLTRLELGNDGTGLGLFVTRPCEGPVRLFGICVRANF